MSSSLALKRTRTKARRKPRKPLPPGWKALLFWFCWAFGWGVYGLGKFVVEQEPWLLLNVAGCAILAHAYWLIWRAYMNTAPLDPRFFMSRWYLGIALMFAGVIIDLVME